MGADIHGVVQERWRGNDGDRQNSWCSVMEVEGERNYALFSALAGVRNYNSVTPISKPRGLPDDFDVIDGDVVKLTYSDTEVWLGDHSHTWLTLEELLDWDGWDQDLGDGTLKEYCRTFWKWLGYIEAKYSDGIHDVRLVIGFDS